MNTSQLNASVVYSGLGMAQENACIVVQHQGDDYRQDARAHIVFIGKRDEAFQNFSTSKVIALENTALCPALVNAHTHLDLSTLPYLESSYSDFVGRVVAHQREGHRGVQAAQQGAENILLDDVRVIGDIVTDEATMRWLLQHPSLRGVAYWEVVSFKAEHADRVFKQTVEQLRIFKKLEQPEGVKLGLSPHTPHTVSAPLLQKLAAFARSQKIPMQIHVAESPQELQLHRGDGELLAQLRPLLSDDWQPSHTTPVRYLQQLGVLAAQPTLVHMVHVDDDDVAMVQRAGCTVVHCPRSNQALNCGVFPWKYYQRHAVTVALGTDSSASAPSLSIKDEFLAAQRMHPHISKLELVRALVKGGHRALAMKPPQLLRGSLATEIQQLPLQS